MFVKAGKQELEISNEQAEELGLPSDPELLGCGTQACAYLSSDGKVVKFSKDKLDAMTSYVISNLAGVTRDWAIPVYGVYRVGDYYAIVTERAEKLPKEWADPINAIYSRSYEMNVQPGEWHEFYEALNEWIQREHPEDRQLHYALEVIDQAVRGFQKLGLDWADFHGGNWGLYKGKPVVIDLGMSSSLDEPPVPEL